LQSVQLVRLRKWAQEQNCWFDDRSQFGDFIDRGSENEVYLSPNSKEIVKLNDFRYSDDNLTSFFERIKAHNKYFDACPYRMTGFAENQEGHVCAILVQPYIDDARLAAFPKHLGHTREQIPSRYIRLGIFRFNVCKMQKKADLCVNNKKKSLYLQSERTFLFKNYY